MLLQKGQVDGIRFLSPESVELLRRDWLNDFTTEKRRHRFGAVLVGLVSLLVGLFADLMDWWPSLVVLDLEPRGCK